MSIETRTNYYLIGLTLAIAAWQAFIYPLAGV